MRPSEATATAVGDVSPWASTRSSNPAGSRYGTAAVAGIASTAAATTQIARDTAHRSRWRVISVRATLTMLPAAGQIRSLRSSCHPLARPIGGGAPTRHRLKVSIRHHRGSSVGVRRHSCNGEMPRFPGRVIVHGLYSSTSTLGSKSPIAYSTGWKSSAVIAPRELQLPLRDQVAGHEPPLLVLRHDTKESLAVNREQQQPAGLQHPGELLIQARPGCQASD